MPNAATRRAVAKRAARCAAAKARAIPCPQECEDPTAASAERSVAATSTCGVPACDNKARPTPCCQQMLCGGCMLKKGVRVCLCSPAHPKYTYICPFCREKRAVAERFMQESMGQHCPHHTQITKSYCPEECEVVMVHRPCAHGCYECDESSVVIRPL